MEAVPADLFLMGYPQAIRDQADRLRRLVKTAEPRAIEQVRTGWRLIGYDLPLGRRTTFFAWIALEPIHVHLGFAYGAWMLDPSGVLQGAHLRLRKVRYLTFVPGQRIARRDSLALIREAALVARLPAADRVARAFDAGWERDPADSEP